ncbi:MAG TPA: hypothetical protein PKY77_25860 [Phycisphaerae bacterium]|nr:hypothetical protein [Phycisphaerae bacterium]HRY71451.1 hypothetical protein [Phycisphaerae bacterium]HSA29998.1 hypothetical protein [Phycisphaerae bacterium]
MFLRTSFASGLVLLCVASGLPSFGQASSSSQPATQPAVDRIAKYHDLLKNEFMTDADSEIILTSRAVQEAIQRARRKAADEKGNVDRMIASLNEEKRSTTENKLAEMDKARALRSEATEHDRKSIKWRIKRGPRGGITRWSSPNYKEQAAAAECRKQGAEHEGEAEKHDREIKRLDAELAPLRRRSDWLALVAVPNGRTLPGKEFWVDLTAEQREQLERVGISREQFRKLLPRIQQTEASFIAWARETERESSRSGDDLVLRLRRYFQDHLSPQSDRTGIARRPVTP